MKKILTLVLSTLMIIAQTSCGGSASEAPKPLSREEFLLDTICTVSVYSIKDESGEIKSAEKSEDAVNAVIDEVFSLCGELEGKLSRTRKDSDISRINASKGEWTSVSEETAKLIQKGLKYSEIAEGEFDISVGRITELWDFHAAPGKEIIPDEKELSAAAGHVDYKKIKTDGNRIILEDPDSKLDLGGIAKGYIGDKMTELLEERGVTSGIINLGGNVICIGGKTEKEDFVIGVEAPFSDRSRIIGKINARDKTIVTSGIYERKIEKDGKIYHHILDTKKGMPAETDLDAVTLTADKGRSTDIDALSTICLIKGSDEGMKLIESIEGVEGIFVLHDGSIKQTSGMKYEPVE